MRVLICGSRDWNDAAMIRNDICKFPAGTVIIEGEARGADSIARDVAITLGFEVLRFPADWDRYHRAAGVIRNQQMLDEGRPDLVVAYHDDIENSKGTRDMIARARKAGIRVVVRKHENSE